MNWYLVIGAVAAYMLLNTTPALKAGEKSFTLYHWTKCSHCRRMMPEWNRLGSSYRGIVIRKVESSSNNEFQVSGYPTLVYRSGNGDVEVYDGGRDYASFMAFLNSKL